MTWGQCVTMAQLSFWWDDLAQAMGTFNPAKGLCGLGFGLVAELGLQPSDSTDAALMSLVPAGCPRTEVALQCSGGTHSPEEGFFI